MRWNVPEQKIELVSLFLEPCVCVCGAICMQAAVCKCMLMCLESEIFWWEMFCLSLLSASFHEISLSLAAA